MKLPTYVDLHVLPRPDDESSIKRMADLLQLSGFCAIGLTLPPGLLRDRIASIRRVFEERGIETLLRVDIQSHSRAELLRLLRRFRREFDLVAVKCVNPAVTSVACRDRRVDVVFFDPTQRNIRFGYAYANLLRGALEFNLISTLLSATSSEAYFRLAKEAAIARASKTNVVLSSGATLPERIRGPMQLSALGGAIGLSRDQSLRGVMDNAESIVRRSLERRSRTYIEEGVKVLLPNSR